MPRRPLEHASESAGMVVRVGGVPFRISDLDAAVDEVIHLGIGRTRPGTPVRLSNSYCVALADADHTYRTVVTGPGITYPDGAPIAWYMRMRSHVGRNARRVRGPSLFVHTLDRGRKSGVRHFVLGGSEETLEALLVEAHRRFPGIQIVGSYSPEYGPLNDTFYQECESRIMETSPDIVWIGLGTPKQDIAATELAAQLPGAFIGVGAAFDFFAGTVKEAPKWMQDSGAEWIYRLMTEPRRLWRRYLIGNGRFAVALVRGIRDA